MHSGAQLFGGRVCLLNEQRRWHLQIKTRGVEVCLLKEHRHWPLQNQARGSRLGSRGQSKKNVTVFSQKR